MTGLDPEHARTALAPLRAELIRRAEADARRTLGTVRAQVHRERDQAEVRAAEITARAQAAGEAAAAADLAAERADARRARRCEILATQRDAYRQLRRAAIATVCDLRHAPDYPDLRESLRGSAIATLGTHASITEAADGGIVAVTAGRRLDLSLTAIACRALDAVEIDIAGLWA